MAVDAGCEYGVSSFFHPSSQYHTKIGLNSRAFKPLAVVFID